MLDALFEQFDNLVVLDTETTGIDCKRDEIIELAALRIVKDGTACRMEEEMDLLVQLSAGRHLSPVIVNLTGITEQMLWEQGRQKEEVCRRFAVLLDHPKTLLVAYNAQFDLCFLYYFLLPFGQTGLLKQIKMLDAMTIYKDRRAYPHKLENAVAAYALKTQNTHRAIDDTKAAFELLQAMEQERADLEQYINLFGYHPKYGVSGPRISSITYRAQAYGSAHRLYESPPLAENKILAGI